MESNFKNTILSIWLFLFSVLGIISCSDINYEEMDTQSKTEEGELVRIEDYGVELRLPVNYAKLSLEELELKLNKLELDSVMINYRLENFLSQTDLGRIYFDTLKPLNYVAIMNHNTYFRLSSNSIGRFMKGVENGSNKVKDYFPNGEFVEKSRSKIQIEKPFKYFKIKLNLTLNDLNWYQDNFIYLKSEMNKRRTVSMIFVDHDEVENYDKYVNSLEFVE